MLKNFSNKKGESLIEIMIAIVILTIVLIGMSKILGNSKITAESSEKRIEAVALAKEGLEIFRYYRKNNYMQYSDKKRICWNFVGDNNSAVDPITNPFNGDGILDGTDEECQESETYDGSAIYYLQNDSLYVPIQNIKDANFGRFYLSDLGKDLNTSWSKKNNGQIFVDLADFQLCKHIETGLIMSCKSMVPDSETFENLPYFRTLKVEYVDSLGQNCGGGFATCDPSNPKSLNQIKVTSSVIWPVGPGIQSVDLTTIFTDYEDRLDRDS